jgi:hypothetical protein
LAIDCPTGPSIGPIAISGSVQSQSSLPAPIASPNRIEKRFAIDVTSWNVWMDEPP